jgi:hypothetical protein
MCTPNLYATQGCALFSLPITRGPLSQASPPFHRADHPPLPDHRRRFFCQLPFFSRLRVPALSPDRHGRRRNSPLADPDQLLCRSLAESRGKLPSNMRGVHCRRSSAAQWQQAQHSEERRANKASGKSGKSGSRICNQVNPKSALALETPSRQPPLVECNQAAPAFLAGEPQTVEGNSQRRRGRPALQAGHCRTMRFCWSSMCFLASSARSLAVTAGSFIRRQRLRN